MEHKIIVVVKGVIANNGTDPLDRAVVLKLKRCRYGIPKHGIINSIQIKSKGRTNLWIS